MSSKLAEGVNLTVDGVVLFSVNGISGFMHPPAFRDLNGEEAYQELLARPRVPSPYPELAGESYDDTPNNPGADIE